MRAEIRARQRAAQRRRNLLVGGVVGVMTLSAGVVVLWPDGDEWGEQPMATGLIPENPGSEWVETESPSSWMRVAEQRDPDGSATSTVKVPRPPAPKPSTSRWVEVPGAGNDYTGTPSPQDPGPSGQPQPTGTNQPPVPTGSTPVPTGSTPAPTDTPTFTPPQDPPPPDPPQCTIVIFNICL